MARAAGRQGNGHPRGDISAHYTMPGAGIALAACHFRCVWHRFTRGAGAWKHGAVLASGDLGYTIATAGPRRAPDKVALTCPGRDDLTFGQLNAMVNRRAHSL